MAATACVFPTKLGTANVDGVFVCCWKTGFGCIFDDTTLVVGLFIGLFIWELFASCDINGEPVTTVTAGVRQEGGLSDEGCWVGDLNVVDWLGRIGEIGDKDPKDFDK